MDLAEAFVAAEIRVSIEEEEDRFRDLWIGVLTIAIEDACGRGVYDARAVERFNGIKSRDFPKLQEKEKARLRAVYRQHLATEALDWFSSKSTEVGSFRWICEKFDADEKAILTGIRALVRNRFN